MEERETAENASVPESSTAPEQGIEGAGTKAGHQALEVAEASKASEDVGRLPRNRHSQANRRKQLFKPGRLKLQTCLESLGRQQRCLFVWPETKAGRASFAERLGALPRSVDGAFVTSQGVLQ